MAGGPAVGGVGVSSAWDAVVGAVFVPFAGAVEVLVAVGWVSARV